MFTLLTAIWLMLVPPAAVPQQEQRFTPVEGATLQAKQDAAARQAASAQQPRFWTAYSFDVRPGVGVDVEFVSEDGRMVINGGTFFSSDSDGLDPRLETRNLGVFVLREAGGQVARVEVYNLARRREYSGHPVYWLGRAGNEESLNFLRGLVESSKSGELAAQALRALALHDDRRVPEILERVARTSAFEGVRVQAVRSLGHPPLAPSARDLLASFARDPRESAEVRRAAIMTYGRSRDAQALAFLQGIYDTLDSRELKRSALSSLARNENRGAAAGFLIKVATQEADMELRKRAVAQLGEIAGQQALGTLTETATKDAETELQKQAVTAIARRPAAESVPLLIKIAQTHQKPEVRRHAFILLGRSGDQAAVDFLRSFLTK